MADPLPASAQDRQAAVTALDAHRAAGRLDDVGYEERSVRADRAATREDLELLFLDLPEPHPVFGEPAWGEPPSPPPVTGTPAYGTPPPAPAPPRMPGAPVPSGPPVGGPVAPRPAAGGLSPEVARRIVAVMPFVALGLFLVTKWWFVFLLIPVVAILLGKDGPGGKRR